MHTEIAARTPFALSPRDSHEHHRVATPLELLFDLASVVAISSAAHSLAHAIASDHILDGLVGYVFAFFAIWWAWMNYTWFASAYGNERPLFRITTMVIIFGALFMAAGIPALFEKQSIGLVWFGFVVMRFGQVALWLMAARGDPERRTTALRYAAGVAMAQVYWTLLLFGLSSGTPLFKLGFLLGMVIELTIPVLAEAVSNTPWHRHHIMERYGLLNIIVLGEGLLVVVNALRKAEDGIGLDKPLVHVAVSATVITFALWWVYFSREEHLTTRELRRAVQWGYGHVVVFAAGAAIAAGFAVLIDILTNHAQVGLRTGDIAVAIPLALYLAGLWFIRDRFLDVGLRRHALLFGAFAVLLAGLFMPASLELMTVLTVLTVYLRCR